MPSEFKSWTCNHLKLRGTNEIASAIAVQLSRAGYCVVLSYDPHPPVIRRKMAFHDALFGDATQVEDIAAERVDDAMQILKALRTPGRMLVSWLGVLDLLPIRSIDVLIDARLQKHRITPDLRRLARLTVGLGPGFAGAFNCDVAVETRPGKIGLVDSGWTDAADGKASQLGNVGAERFVYTPFAGCWHTAIEIGTLQGSGARPSLGRSNRRTSRWHPARNRSRRQRGSGGRQAH